MVTTRRWNPYAATVPPVAPLSVAVVNDYAIVVAGVAAALEPYTDRVRVVELDSRTPVVSKVDVVLLDSFGQVQGGDIDLAAMGVPASAKVLAFSWNTDTELVDATLGAGVAGYVSKQITASELVDAIEQVHRGVAVRPTSEEEPGDGRFGRWPGQELGLSPREAEVLAMVCEGLSNDEIAGRLFIGINTVKTYLKALYVKTGTGSRTQAVLWGIDHGMRPDRVRTLRR